MPLEEGQIFEWLLIKKALEIPFHTTREYLLRKINSSSVLGKKDLLYNTANVTVKDQIVKNLRMH